MLLTFFVVSYIVTWSLWFAARMTPAAGPRAFLFLLGTFTPGFVALWLTFRASGRSGVAALLRRLVDWQVPARWYVFAVSYLAVVKLVVALLHRAVTGAWPRFGDEPFYLMLAATVVSTLVGGQAGEELGWRGYALPRLTAWFGLGGASVLLGLVWAVWHLPLFFVPEATTFGQSFPLYLVQVTALSVAIAWLYANTHGSLLPVMLMHRREQHEGHRAVGRAQRRKSVGAEPLARRLAHGDAAVAVRGLLSPANVQDPTIWTRDRTVGSHLGG